MNKLCFLFFVFCNLAFAKNTISIEELNSIYGLDDRHFVNKNSKAKILELSKSIAVIISKDDIDKGFLYSKINANLLSDINGLNLCKDQKFSNNHTMNSCTGFLISDDLLVSAGHCFLNISDCDRKSIVFNLQSKNEIKTGYSISNNNIYECSEILTNNYASKGAQDFVIIRLKKKVMNLKPLKFRMNGAISTNDQVFMMGHPMGLPLIVTGNALVNDINATDSFIATLDSFEGNSGSPVFNSKNFEVEGILVRGQEDFYFDESRSCYLYKSYDQGPVESPVKTGEVINRIQDILPFLKMNSIK